MSKYEIKKQFSTGFFKIRNKKTGDIRCLNQIPILQADILSLINELQILKKLNHPNIIKFYKCFIEGTNLCVILEYIDSINLESLLEKQKSGLSESKILNYLQQLTSALIYCKSNQILHRDLKPENIFLTKKDEIKVADFGLSIHLCENNAHSFAGTPFYMSPEIVSGKPYSFPADIWSLGCIIYQMMMLQTPFESDTPLDSYAKIVSEHPPPINGDYSPGLKNIVMRMLEKDPEMRITLPEIQSFLDSINEFFGLKKEGLLDADDLFNYALALECIDRVGSMKYFKLSADLGNVSAMEHYGLALEEGWNGKPNFIEAMKYYKMGSTLKDPDSMFCYAYGLKQGYLGIPDRKKSMKYYKMASDLGHYEASFNYAIGLEEGDLGIPDLKQAMKYYKIAADGGVVAAMYNYAVACTEEYHNEVNFDEALKYFKMASDKYDIDATKQYEKLIQMRCL